MSTKSFIDNPISRGLNEIRHSWGWFLAAGILLILFGTVCIVADVAATFVTVLAFGWLLLLGGIVSLVQAFSVHNWKGFFLLLLNALFRGFTGYLLIRYPAVGAVSLTLVLASFFIVGGTFRAISSTMLELPRSGWSVFSGLISIALGIMLLVQMPVSSVWFIGFALGLDMIFDGTSLIAFATAIHSLPTPYETRAKAA